MRIALPIRKQRIMMAFALLCIALPLVFLTNLIMGSVNISFRQLYAVLIYADKTDITVYNILMNIRLPQTITAMLAGIGLSIGGLQMQTLFRNPLAEPSILGISSGASLGVAILMLFSGSIIGYSGDFGLFSDIGISLAAFIGSVLSMMVIIGFSSRVGNHISLLIVGLMIGYFISAFVGVLQFFSYKEDLQSYVLWGFGNFSGVGWRRLPLFSVIVFTGAVFSMFLVKPLNAWLLGDDYARNLGINVKRTRIAVIFCTGLLTAAVTAYCGPIAFIGLAIPHLCRGLFKTWNHATLTPAVMLAGAILALICNIIVRLPWFDNVLPVNAVTALLGAPVVIWVIVNQRYRSNQNDFQ